MKLFNSPRKIFFIFLLSSFCRAEAFSQTTTNSPYSIFGLGDLESPAFSPSVGMGRARYSLAFPYSINIANPASYGFLPLPTFDAGFTSNFIAHSYRDSIKKANSTYFKNFAFAFPVSKRWWASSFGLVPYSKMGYNITTKDSVNNFGTVTNTFLGSGGISRFFVGNSFNLLKDSIQQLSMGVNVSYLFGSLVRSSSVVPDASLSAFSTKVENTATIGDFFFDLGAIYSKKINISSAIALGADYELGKNMKATNTVLAATYTGSGLNEQIKDTIVADTLDGSVFLPSKIGAGISYFFNNQWLFAADFSLQDWSEFTFLEKNPGLAKHQELSVGIQYNYNAKERENLLKMMWYRTGFRFANTSLLLKDQQVKEYGITFGVGIPIGEKTKGSFNLSMETGIRGENKNGLAREQFTNIIVGFSFTPSYYDRWFVKPKID